MILIDTSAWIEFLRGNPSPAAHQVRALLAIDTAASCDAVGMESWPGHAMTSTLRTSSNPRPDADLADRPERLRARSGPLPTCRRYGETVRKLIDCLIAAVAIREEIPVLHADADFDVLARWTPLRVA